MKHLLRVSLVGIALSASVLAFSQSAVGNWNGRLDATAMKPRNAQEQQAMGQIKAMLGNIKARLTMKGNRTYTIVITGGPGGKSQTETGKWTQSGRTITVRDKKGKPQKMTISANGRTMVMTSNDPSVPKGIKMIFNRA